MLPCTDWCHTFIVQSTHFLEGFIGDAFLKSQLWLFADADHAGEHDSKSNHWQRHCACRPNTYYPLNAFSKKQTVVAISSTEAEVVAANHSMRAEGIPMLALFEQLNLFKKLQGKPARDAAKPQEDVVFTRIDPELTKSVMGTLIQVVVLRTSTPSRPVSLNFIKSNLWRTTKRLSQSCPPVHQHP